MLFNTLTRPFRRSLVRVLAVGVLVAPLSATWSISVINVKTGEVVVAGATCIQDFNVIQPITSVVVGKGAGNSQSGVFHGAKVRIFNGLMAGQTPQEILDVIVNDAPNLPLHQFGVVGLNGPPVTLTGSNNGGAALGVAGSVGDLRYAIQGNVLASDEVVFAAVQALEQSEGDLGQRVMIAMEAAAAEGGDGRCSCTGGIPNCGTPPADFVHSAFTSFILIARHGDTDSVTCGNGNANCSNGDYYARLTNSGNLGDPDPILRLRRAYNQWRIDQSGRADQLLSEVHVSDQLVQANGVDELQIDVSLVDLNGDPLLSGGPLLVATAVEDPGVTISAVNDNGDGSYSLSVLGGSTPGSARVRLVVQDGIRDVQLYPEVEFEVVAPSDLFANRSELSATVDEQVAFELNDLGNAGGGYHIFGSASGSSPGTPWGSVQLPLNRDRLFAFTSQAPPGSGLVNTVGQLDAAGQASAWMSFRSEALQNFVGGRFEFVAYLPGRPDRITNLVGMDVAP